jgi:hypothetical protein
LEAFINFHLIGRNEPKLPLREAKRAVSPRTFQTFNVLAQGRGDSKRSLLAERPSGALCELLALPLRGPCFQMRRQTTDYYQLAVVVPKKIDSHAKPIILGGPIFQVRPK